MFYFTLFFTSLAFIALRAFQQLNVQHDRYRWVPPTTTMMAFVEVAGITTIIKNPTLLAALPMAAGGILGCWFSMWLHQRMRNKNVKPDRSTSPADEQPSPLPAEGPDMRTTETVFVPTGFGGGAVVKVPRVISAKALEFPPIEWHDLPKPSSHAG